MPNNEQNETHICPDCGLEIQANQEYRELQDGRRYHTSCTRLCQDCQEYCRESETCALDIHGEERIVCLDCRDDNYRRCECCNEWVDAEIEGLEEVIIRNGIRTITEYWCQNCIANEPNIRWDEEAEAYIYNTNTNRSNMEDRPITWQTGPMNDRNRIVQEFLDSEKSRKRCPNCMNEPEACSDCLKKQAEARKKEELTLWIYDTQHCNYHDSLHRRFKGLIYRMPHEHPYLYYGIELECIFGDNADKAKTVHEFIVATNGLFVSEYDSSVDRIGNGAEFISRPLSYKAWNSKKVQDLLKAGVEVLTKAGAKIDQPKGCGLHIHMSMPFFETNTKKKVSQIKDDIDWIFQYYQKEIEAISGREYSDYCMSKKDRIEKSLPMMSRDLGVNIGIRIKKGKLPSTLESNNNHHYAIVATPKTIEVRTFKSTLDVDRILATIQFCRAIAHTARNMKFTKDTTFGDIIHYKQGQQLTDLVQKLKLNTERKIKDTVELQ